MAIDYDYIVIGSGFGGSVAALRLSEKGYRVGVIEQGRRWSPGDLPRSNWNLRRWIWRPRLGLRGFFNITPFRHVLVLHGHAVGGGSITYANTLLAPPASVWRKGSWVGLADWEAVMPGHFATARRMLGVARNRRSGPADARLKVMADAAGIGDSYRLTDVGVFFGDDGDAPGARHADPYFGGEGPARSSCIGCGGCMVGCRHGAKNTLDLNYLYLAERRGAEILAETRVVDVRPLDGGSGASGYAVTSVPSGALPGRRRRTLRCRGVVFSGGSLGTQDLLFRMKVGGALPRLSDALGTQVRTNAESLIGVRYPGSKVDLSTGVAIGSGVYLDEHTHIEATRYPRGSDAMGLLMTVLVGGRSGRRSIGLWARTLAKRLLRNPWRTVRALQPFGFARETIILLCMQTLDGTLRMRLRRRWYWPFSRTLATEGPRIPTCIPEANAFAEKAAAVTGGVAGTSITEILFDLPMTAHCMGGAPMAADAVAGVCDGRQRVFGYHHMYICDGSVLGANLGVNPSLTITALAEHAMSHVPPADSARDPEDRCGPTQPAHRARGERQTA